MPEMEEKTPAYEVLIWVTNSTDPIKVKNLLTYDEAKIVIENLRPPPATLVNIYHFGDQWVNKSHIIRCQISPQMELFFPDGNYIFSEPMYRPIFLEDKND